MAKRSKLEWWSWIAGIVGTCIAIASYLPTCSGKPEKQQIPKSVKTLWHAKIHAQTNEQSHIDQAVQVVRELCLAGKEYNISVDIKGHIVIKSLQPGIEGTAVFNASEAKGAPAIHEQKLRIIADGEVRACTREHISRILDAALGQKAPSTQKHLEPITSEKIKSIAAQNQQSIDSTDPEGLRITAAALAKGGEEGLKWTSRSGRDITAGESLTNEYNQLVRRATSLLKTDPYIQALQEISKNQYPDVAARTVKRLAEELVQYLTSFESSKALAQTAAALAKGGEEGLKWTSRSGRDITAGNTLVREYNYLVQRAKVLYGTNRSIQGFEEIPEGQYPDIAAKAVERSAPALERALASL